uniref:Uncharacterized protein n=1 Tax=Avena sativa TaxID=4498 RepID=A0ACD5T8H0_AVESA
MGLCLSVALRKDNVYAADRRRRCRGGHGHDDDVNVLMGGGVSDYGVPLGAGALKVDEAVAPQRRPSGVLERAGTPIWQRRVLMGVKCQLPRFSGMILYDERGRPVRSGIILRDRARDQEKHAAAINILRDML